MGKSSVYVNPRISAAEIMGAPFIEVDNGLASKSFLHSVLNERKQVTNKIEQMKQFIAEGGLSRISKDSKRFYTERIELLFRVRKLLDREIEQLNKECK